MKKYILAIDQGTTSSRVVLYDVKFKINDKFKIKNAIVLAHFTNYVDDIITGGVR